ncbi:hypothetical protein ONA24_05115 [Mycoplasmopsis cynos]|uniref:hypothetical protein n=1 Tax=Mycoplasmopsis cynos TaxID=171284 RepID=UPI0024C5E980|nr:hypothetical protein [Mycoplasmopsis cynos]WAM09396.1 hypothetical protein ONA24_05115 [Mycoplasmopsis cynos]
MSIQCANNNQKNRNVLHTPRERERERDWEEAHSMSPDKKNDNPQLKNSHSSNSTDNNTTPKLKSPIVEERGLGSSKSLIHQAKTFISNKIIEFQMKQRILMI